MKNERLEAGRAAATLNGANLDDDTLLAIFDAMVTKSPVVFEDGDFVSINEGMGEMGHARVEGRANNGYRVRPYYRGRFDNYTIEVAAGDVQRLSTPAAAAAYEALRRGE